MADLSKMKPLPPLTQVAGLGNVFQDAVKAVDEVKNAGKSLATEIGAFRDDVNTVRQHVRREHEDFHFKIGTLGNGGGEDSEKKSDDSSEKQEITGDQVGNAGGVLDVNR